MRRSGIICILAWLMLVGCSQPAPSDLPKSLPTAVPPESLAGAWGISFAVEFPPGFWSDGVHRYGFHLQCPIPIGNSEDFGSEWQEFQVSDEVQPQLEDTDAYLRLNGISRQPFASVLENPVVHPDQRTIGIIHLVGLSQDDARLAGEECEALFSWDQGMIAPLSPLSPFRQ